jgi:hypothetical protein
LSVSVPNYKSSFTIFYTDFLLTKLFMISK